MINVHFKMITIRHIGPAFLVSECDSCSGVGILAWQELPVLAPHGLIIKKDLETLIYTV